MDSFSTGNLSLHSGTNVQGQLQMATKTVIGADACPAGWFVTIVERGTLQTDVHPNFSALRDAHAEADQILVDIPIGPDERWDLISHQFRKLSDHSRTIPPQERGDSDLIATNTR